jgi:hypothetical protein
MNQLDCLMSKCHLWVGQLQNRAHSQIQGDFTGTHAQLIIDYAGETIFS